jgi:hypothetical protein
MSNPETQNTSLTTYISAELLTTIQREARLANRSLAAQVRHNLQTLYTARPKVEQR